MIVVVLGSTSAICCLAQQRSCNHSDIRHRLIMRWLTFCLCDLAFPVCPGPAYPQPCHSLSSGSSSVFNYFSRYYAPLGHCCYQALATRICCCWALEPGWLLALALIITECCFPPLLKSCWSGLALSSCCPSTLRSCRRSSCTSWSGRLRALSEICA